MGVRLVDQQRHRERREADETWAFEMNFCQDRPHDRLVTERIQVFSGYIKQAGAELMLSARCGEQEIPLRGFSHPAVNSSKNIQAFWGYLFLQQLLPYLRNDFLNIELSWNGQPIQSIHLRVSPVAKELAAEHPLNLRTYAVRNYSDCRVQRPFTLVFPGLGAVGGTALNQLMRLKMFREDWRFPVYSEANDARLWDRICLAESPAVRWIDGHECYSAADRLSRPFARITLLRDPIRRFLSIYNYASIVHPSEFPYATFDEFIASGNSRQFSQAFGLLKCAGIRVPSTIPEGDLYDLARNELDQSYALVGITEHFEESIFLICDLAGYADIGMWWKSLSAPRSVSQDDLSDEVIQKMRSILEVDLQLYREYREKFLKLLARAGFGRTLQEYKEDASRERDIPEGCKMIECLRWRQILVEEQFSALKRSMSIEKAPLRTKIARAFGGGLSAH